jgi:uracil phosphoribosyltransferase
MYRGKRHSNAQVCGVSILRAGETMELALCEVYKDAQIGKILIQTNENSGEPEVLIFMKFKICYLNLSIQSFIIYAYQEIFKRVSFSY